MTNEKSVHRQDQAVAEPPPPPSQQHQPQPRPRPEPPKNNIRVINDNDMMAEGKNSTTMTTTTTTTPSPNHQQQKQQQKQQQQQCLEETATETETATASTSACASASSSAACADETAQPLHRCHRRTTCVVLPTTNRRVIFPCLHSTKDSDNDKNNDDNNNHAKKGHCVSRKPPGANAGTGDDESSPCDNELAKESATATATAAMASMKARELDNLIPPSPKTPRMFLSRSKSPSLSLKTPQPPLNLYCQNSPVLASDFLATPTRCSSFGHESSSSSSDSNFCRQDTDFFLTNPPPPTTKGLVCLPHYYTLVRATINTIQGSGWCFKAPSKSAPALAASSSSSSSSSPSWPSPRSILRRPKMNPMRKKEPNSEESIPSLISSETEFTTDDDDDDNASLTSLGNNDHDDHHDEGCSHQGRDEGTRLSSSAEAVEAAALHDKSPSSTLPIDEKKRGDETASNCKSRVSFDPHVWVYQFQRSKKEYESIWWTPCEMDRFKRQAVQRVLSSIHATTELVPTGTGRLVRKPLLHHHHQGGKKKKGALFTSPALSSLLDDNDDEDETAIQRHAQLEIRNILVVDPHDVCLNLFAKALKSMTPHVQITTAKSSEEAMRKVAEMGTRTRFDVAIVEERLQKKMGGVVAGHEGDHYHNNKIINRGDGGGASRGCCRPSPPLHDHHVSGSSFIKLLSSQDPHCLYVGISVHHGKHEETMLKNGADLVWSKPPPPLDRVMRNRLLNRILVKRGKTQTAMRYFA